MAKQRRSVTAATALSMFILLASVSGAAADWPHWRGPNGNNVAPDGQTLPTEFSDSQNVIWKTPVPGRGHSSPIVVGDRVMLTTADEQRQTQSVVCFDRATGDQKWITEVSRGGFPAHVHKKNTHATPTLACDGQRVFAVFCNHDNVQVTALDLDGEQLWQKVAGPYTPQKYKYGYAPSPLIYKSAVIITAEFEQGYIVALNKQTGEQVWRTSRGGNTSYSTPAVANIGGREQLFITGDLKLSSYDPATGRSLWSAAGIAAATCGTVVWDNGLVFGSGGFPQRQTMAVRADGSGEVIWRDRSSCYEQSLLAADGHLYAFTDTGIATCWKADDGTELWKERLGGPVSASPLFAGGRVYMLNERGTHFVIKPNPQKLDLVAQNQLGDEGFASPIAVGNRLYIRTATGNGPQRREILYCLGEK